MIYVHVFIRMTLLILIVLGAKSCSTQQLLGICCSTLVSCSLLFIGTHFNVNEILVFFCVGWGYHHGVTLECHILYFKISKHIGGTNLC
jgi:hypothetical protein